MGRREVAADLRDRSAARLLGARLLKAARRPRAKEEFIFLATREEIGWAAALWPPMAIAPGAFPRLTLGAWKGIEAFHRASKRRRGRPTNSHAKREEIEGGKVPNVDERHRKRVAREARYERRFRGWLAKNGGLIGAMHNRDPWPEK